MRILKLSFSLIALFCFCTTATFAQESTTAIETQEAVTPKSIKIKVKGVGCSRDIQAIATKVGSVIGVSNCEMIKKGATTTFAVTFNPSLATEKAIYSAVESTPGCSNQSARPYKVKL